jgi:hypothetical protein
MPRRTMGSSCRPKGLQRSNFVILSEAKNLFYRDERPFAEFILRHEGLRVTVA